MSLLKRLALFVLFTGALIWGYGVYMDAEGTCRYEGGLAMCQAAMEPKCGAVSLTDSSGCEAFVDQNETCYCSACGNCLGQEAWDHCALSRDERVARCRKQLGVE